MSDKIVVGLLGFGHCGKYLYDSILNDPATSSRFEVGWVWNRTASALDGDITVPKTLRLESLDEMLLENRKVHLVVEVAHPSISAQWASKVIEAGIDFYIGSPTAMADPTTEDAIRKSASMSTSALYIPAGALWGAQDIQSMANRNNLNKLTITMKKHPASFRLTDTEVDLKRESALDIEGEVVLYEGPVRGLCPLAPNNVNTMACAAMAAHTLGFDGTIGRLVCDRDLETHEVEIEALGHPNPKSGARFQLHVCRSSPAPPGAVTSTATYGSFLESMRKAHGRGNGVHFV